MAEDWKDGLTFEMASAITIMQESAQLVCNLLRGQGKDDLAETFKFAVQGVIGDAIAYGKASLDQRDVEAEWQAELDDFQRISTQLVNDLGNTAYDLGERGKVLAALTQHVEQLARSYNELA